MAPWEALDLPAASPQFLSVAVDHDLLCARVVVGASAPFFSTTLVVHSSVGTAITKVSEKWLIFALSRKYCCTVLQSTAKFDIQHPVTELGLTTCLSSASHPCVASVRTFHHGCLSANKPRSGQVSFYVDFDSCRHAVWAVVFWGWRESAETILDPVHVQLRYRTKPAPPTSPSCCFHQQDVFNSPRPSEETALGNLVWAKSSAAWGVRLSVQFLEAGGDGLVTARIQIKEATKNSPLPMIPICAVPLSSVTFGFRIDPRFSCYCGRPASVEKQDSVPIVGFREGKRVGKSR